jgi:hypothetical protein
MENPSEAMNRLPQGAGSRLDADTLRRKRPEDFAATNGDSTEAFSALNLLLAGYVEGTEITAPAAGSANSFRLFARDNGAGKTQLCVIFNTGAIQVIATQP